MRASLSGLARTQWMVAAAVLIGAAAIAAAIVVVAGDDDEAPRELGVFPSTGTLRQPIHEHADFAVYIRGERIDFGQPQYISVENKELSPNVHIHDPRHTVVHVHREGTTWDEFFRSLGFELTDVTMLAEPEDTRLALPDGEVLRITATERFTFIVNGVPVDGIAGLNIGALDRVLVSYGAEPEAEVLARFAEVTDQACIPQGVCAARGSGSGEHGEPCATGSGQCN